MSRPFDASASVGLRRGFQVSGGPEAILRQGAVLWLDALYSNAGQTATNLGTGGTALNATLGSTAGADSNDPLWLPNLDAPYVYFPGAGAQYLELTNNAGLSIAGDIEFIARIAMDSWNTGAAQGVASKANAGTSWRIFISNTGLIELGWWDSGGTLRTRQSTVATGLAAGTTKWIRITLDVNNDASGHDVKFFTGDDGTTWTQLGATVTTAGTTSVNLTNDNVFVGRASGNNGALKVFRFIIKNGIDGTIAADVDCSKLTTSTATSFTEQSVNAANVSIVRTTTGRKAVTILRQPVWLFGTDDYMSVPDNDQVDFTDTQSFTVLAVARVFSTVVVNTRLVDKMDGSALNGWGLFLDATPRAQATMNGTSYLATPTSATITLGAMNVLGMQRDASVPNLRALLNTALGTASTVTRPNVSNALTVRIGIDRGGTNALAGELAAVAIFRRILTAAELQQIVTYYQTRYV